MHELRARTPLAGDDHELRAPAPSRLVVRWHRVHENRCLVDIEGEVDLGSAPVLKVGLGEVLDEIPAGDLVLDLSGLSHLDSTGLAVLIAFRRRLGAEHRLVLGAPSDQIIRLLELTGLRAAFDTFPTVAGALAYLDEPTTDGLPLSPDAALVLGLGAASLPFADSYAGEVQCWLRLLLPGSTGNEAHPTGPPGTGHEGQSERLDRVSVLADRAARERGATVVRTGDVLRAVSSVYGLVFERGIRGLGNPAAVLYGEGAPAAED